MKHIHKKLDDDRTGIIWRKPEAQHILTMAAFWDFLSKKYLRQISILFKFLKMHKSFAWEKNPMAATLQWAIPPP